MEPVSHCATDIHMQIFADTCLRVDAACPIMLLGFLRDKTKGAGLHSFFSDFINAADCTCDACALFHVRYLRSNSVCKENIKYKFHLLLFFMFPIFCLLAFCTGIGKMGAC